MYFSNNIRFLRKRKGRTQDDVAQALQMKRSTLSGYENNVAKPGVEVLIAFSEYFRIAVDTLIKTDLAALPESQMIQLERGYDVYIKGSNLRILATTVDSENTDNIELVNEKARAGYKSGFTDPEYIRILPTFRLPFLSRERKYRTFQISGDSMLPIPDKSWVTGEYVENWQYLKDGQPCIILTLDDGIVFKIVENRIEKSARLILHSLNPAFEPYEIDIKDVKEIWKFVHYISSEMPEANTENGQLIHEVRELRNEIKAMQLKLNL
ncbi:MAG: LexA family transcriptional regulator [Bacteroidales bacterium]|nr:LexA family transcriptional regulator [Bacteroidales bacterium]